MIDIVREIEAVRREVGSGRIANRDARTVRISRTYDTPIQDVWDAVTNPARISRWFLPISGDYRVGGRYQLEGNAGGEILVCQQPQHLRVSWVYGEMNDPADISEVDVSLTAEGDARTTLVLEHTAVVPEDRWQAYGPGAVGVGWDGGLLGLTLHLRSESVGDSIAWQMSEEGRSFNTHSSQAWGEASVAAGTDPSRAASAVANTTAFYAPAEEVPMAMDRIGTIEALLAEAGGAHGVYERTELNGVYDNDWPRWYADYAVDHGMGALLGRDVTADELTGVLESSWEAFQQADPKPVEPWTTWIARQIAQELAAPEA